MLHGIEIEFAGNMYLRENLNRWLWKHELPFYCGTDTSANIGVLEGYELRSTEPFQRFSDIEKQLDQTLFKIKEMEGRTHKTCGFHVHFSGYGMMDTSIISNLLREKGYNWNCRTKWCASHGRYQRIRHVLDIDYPDHYEIRVFNSTLSFRGIKAMFHQATKIITMPESLIQYGPKLVEFDVVLAYGPYVEKLVFSYSDDSDRFSNVFREWLIAEIIDYRYKYEQFVHQVPVLVSFSRASGYDNTSVVEFIATGNALSQGIGFY